MFTINAKRLIGGMILAAAAASPTWAATLSFNPSSANVTVGNSFAVDVLISDLGVSEQLGAFDLQVNFNPALLSFASYNLGSQLGTLATGDALDFSLGNQGGGTLHLGEVSLLWDLSSQAKSFSLGTLHFTASAAGNSSLSFSNVTLGDAWGAPLAANLTTASVSSLAAVPEPETYAMFLAGLGLLGAIARRRR